MALLAILEFVLPNTKWYLNILLKFETNVFFNKILNYPKYMIYLAFYLSFLACY
jgi:hypothetical protein